MLIPIGVFTEVFLVKTTFESGCEWKEEGVQPAPRKGTPSERNGEQKHSSMKASGVFGE